MLGKSVHGGMSEGAIGFDAFFQNVKKKNIEEIKYDTCYFNWKRWKFGLPKKNYASFGRPLMAYPLSCKKL